jgi:hypothetical protein
MADLDPVSRSEPVFAINCNAAMANLLLSLTTQAAAKGPDAHTLGDLHDAATAAVEHFKGQK